MKRNLLVLMVIILLLTGCDQPAKAKSVSGGSGTIEAINHTHWAINHFSVDGQSGLDIIGPWQGGGGGCCYGVPAKWKPGMTVKLEWETGVGYSMDFPGYGDDAKYLAWEKKIKAQNREHSQIVPVPDYTGQKTCGIKVHFLPCDQIKVTTSCYDYGNPNYPIKDPIKMEEPRVCPQ
ncbi:MULTISPECIES: DUF3304 domain-containing protein [Klebsiella]|uniref:DUF3304 domain-containing protein n=1 Tax=Klebsiella TaxID=570 RepID=UPI00189E75DD|nr:MULTISPECIES: DUF3304 domain-containing protein [Klebsiella]MDV1069380.1 DUF3304 domain-containing protein [Klebsiella pasteurii]MDV1075385.1 DUF3304 domain-containing protein [Klebsiella pasteurii]QPF29624.1 DUF3304 domain-containing protein [Klebsiella sp. BDA134-6]